VDVLLLASAQLTPENFQRIEDQKVPYVLLDRKFIGLDANYVGVDDEAAGMLASTHLIEQGCQRIAHIRGPEASTAIRRVEGYKRALAAHHRVSIAGHIISTGTSGDHRGERGGYNCATQLLTGNIRPDGIFCFNDPVSLGAMRAILDAGLRIPQDVAVEECGNLSYADFLRVPLSTIDQSNQTLGERAAKLALSLAVAILGSRSALPADFKEVIAMLEAGRFPVDRAVSAIVELEEAPTIMARWPENSALFTKIMVQL
jgi:LacI family transcriptional regulator